MQLTDFLLSAHFIFFSFSAYGSSVHVPVIDVPFTMLRDITQDTLNSVGRLWSARRWELYLTTLNNHTRQASMSSVGFETTIAANERTQTQALDRAATGIGSSIYTHPILAICIIQYLLVKRNKPQDNENKLAILPNKSKHKKNNLCSVINDFIFVVFLENSFPPRVSFLSVSPFTYIQRIFLALLHVFISRYQIFL
jgi:hypothetical protein